MKQTKYPGGPVLPKRCVCGAVVLLSQTWCDACLVKRVKYEQGIDIEVIEPPTITRGKPAPDGSQPGLYED